VTYKERVAEAINDPAWQAFRQSLKGKPTYVKLGELRDYSDGFHDDSELSDEDILRVNLRIENYLTALARGGQLAVVRDRIDDEDKSIGRYHQSLLNGSLHILK
jgi:hypothetical protein